MRVAAARPPTDPRNGRADGSAGAAPFRFPSKPPPSGSGAEFIPPILPSLSRLKKPGTYHEHVRMSRPAELLSPTVDVLGSQSSRSVPKSRNSQIGRAHV